MLRPSRRGRLRRSFAPSRRGGGYFDGTFRDRTKGAPWLLGVALELQIVARVPMGPLDRAMDGIVTEAGIRWRNGAT